MRSKPFIFAILTQHRGNQLVFERLYRHVDAPSDVRLRELLLLSQIQNDEMTHVLEHIEDVERCGRLYRQGLLRAELFLRHQCIEVNRRGVARSCLLMGEALGRLIEHNFFSTNFNFWLILFYFRW